MLRERVRTRWRGSSQQAVDGLRPCLSRRSSIAILSILGASVKLTLDSILEAYESRSFRQHQAEVDAKFRVED